MVIFNTIVTDPILDHNVLAELMGPEIFSLEWGDLATETRLHDLAET